MVQELKSQIPKERMAGDFEKIIGPFTNAIYPTPNGPAEEYGRERNLTEDIQARLGEVIQGRISKEIKEAIARSSALILDNEGITMEDAIARLLKSRIKPGTQGIALIVDREGRVTEMDVLTYEIEIPISGPNKIGIEGYDTRRSNVGPVEEGEEKEEKEKAEEKPRASKW